MGPEKVVLIRAGKVCVQTGPGMSKTIARAGRAEWSKGLGQFVRRGRENDPDQRGLQAEGHWTRRLNTLVTTQPNGTRHHRREEKGKVKLQFN